MTTPQKTYEELRDAAAVDMPDYDDGSGLTHAERHTYKYGYINGADWARKFTLEECADYVLAKDDCFYWTPQAYEKYKSQAAKIAELETELRECANKIALLELEIESNQIKSKRSRKLKGEG